MKTKSKINNQSLSFQFNNEAFIQAKENPKLMAK